MPFEPFAVPPNVRSPVRTLLQPHMLAGGNLKGNLACLGSGSRLIRPTAWKTGCSQKFTDAQSLRRSIRFGHVTNRMLLRLVPCRDAIVGRHAREEENP